MAVKNGVAWAEDTKYAKPYYKWFSHYERVPGTREIVTKGEFIMQLGMMEGDCDECHQSPCPHIAFLLGWTKEVKE